MKKIISLFIVICLIFNMTVGVFANSNEDLITDLNEAIELIEKVFLHTDEKGISTISKEASRYIDPTLLNNIIISMENVNTLVKKNELSYVDNELILKENTTKANAMVSTLRYAEGGVTKTVTRWYGIDMYYNAYDSGIAAAQFAQAASVGTGVTIILGIGNVYVGSVAGIYTADLAYISATCWLGNATNRGTIVHCLLVPVTAGMIGATGFSIVYMPTGAKLQDE